MVEVFPECAPYTTLSGQVGCASLPVQRTATRPDVGEATAAFSMVSNVPGNKVAAGSEIRGEPGSGAIWAYNEVMILAPGFAETGQSNEIDVANFTGHRGDEDGLYGLGAPWSVGHTFAALGYRNTSALIFYSYDGENPSWNRGLTFFPGSIKQSAIQDFSSGKYSVDIRGNPEFAYSSLSPEAKMYQGGPMILPAIKAPPGRTFFVCVNDVGEIFSRAIRCQ